MQVASHGDIEMLLWHLFSMFSTYEPMLRDHEDGYLYMNMRIDVHSMPNPSSIPS